MYKRQVKGPCPLMWAKTVHRTLRSLISRFPLSRDPLKGATYRTGNMSDRVIFHTIVVLIIFVTRAACSPINILSACVCVTFVVFTDFESCTRPISNKPGICGSGRVWANAWDMFRRVVRFGCGGISCFFSFFFLRTHTACCKYEVALPHSPLY